MDPITAVGAAASITQLLALCGKSAMAAKQLWDSYSDAPKELQQLAEKLQSLKFLIQQIEAAGSHLATEDMDYLLPLTHRATITASLAGYATQLEQLKSLQRGRHAFGPKLRWALLDKSKASQIIKAITEREHDLNACLAIVQM
jgi:hypothetical protein